MRVIVINNYMTPYRQDLFAEIHRLRGETEVEFIYVSRPEARRRAIGWNPQAGVADTHIINLNDPAFVRASSGQRISLPLRTLMVLVRRRCDILVCTLSRDMMLVQILSLILVRLRRGRLVVWIGDVESEVARGRITRWVDQVRLAVARRADGYVFYSRKSRDWAVAKGLPVDRGHVWIGGQVRRRIVDDVPAAPRCPDHPVCRILLVGGDDPRKGMAQLIEDLSTIADRFDARFEVILVGGKARYRTRRENVRVISIGLLQADALARAYTVADMAVIASRHEPWGFVFNEAILQERACIVSEHAGASTVAGRFGLVYTPGDPESLCAAIRRARRISAPDMAALAEQLSVSRAAASFVAFANGILAAGRSEIIDY